MKNDDRKQHSRTRETQSQYLARITERLDGLNLRIVYETVRVTRGKIPPVALLENATIDLEITMDQNRALAAFIAHCKAGGHGCLSIYDLPEIDTAGGLGRMMGLPEAVEENRRLREMLGARVVRKVA